MTPESTTLQRIETLEIHQAFQEDLIQKLNQRIFEQQQQLDAIVTSYRHLADKVKSLTNDSQAPMPAQVKPPHY